MEKRLLVIKSAVCLPVTGADISMFERLELLKRDFGWESRIFSLAPKNHAAGIKKVLKNLQLDASAGENSLEYQYRDIPAVISFDDAYDASLATGRAAMMDGFQRCLVDWPPGICVGNVKDLPVLFFLTQRLPESSFFFLTEDEYIRPHMLEGSLEGGMVTGSMQSLRHVAVASDFLRESLKESWGVEAQVYLNAVNVDHYILEKEEPGQFITMLQPYTHKGIGIFLGVVRSMPDQPFLIAGGIGEDYRRWKKEFPKYPNLRQLPYTRDTAAIFRESYMVLVPSIWEEVFGRVVVEALASGTPVIASDTGGIRTSGGDAAIYLQVNKMKQRKVPQEQNLEQWIEAINSLKDPAFYSAQVAKARERTEWYREALNQELARLDQHLTSILK